MGFKLGQKIIDIIRGKNNKISNISKSVIFKIHGKLEIDKTAEITEGVVLQNGKNCKIKIGKYTQIGPYSILYGGNITIGDYVMIAPHVVIATGDHDYVQIEKPMRFAGCINEANVIIEDDVWIGANTTITSGVTIGTGAVVGANSVVTKNVTPYAVVAGAPAITIKMRK